MRTPYPRTPRRTLLYVRRDGTEVALKLQGRHTDATVGSCLALYEARVQPGVICDRYDVARNVLEDWCRRAGVIRSEAEAAHVRYVHEQGLSLVALGHQARPLYEGEGLSLQAVADRLGCCRARLRAGLVAAGVPIRARGETRRRARRPAPVPVAASPARPTLALPMPRPPLRRQVTLADRLASGAALHIRRVNAGDVQGLDGHVVDADGTITRGISPSVVLTLLQHPQARVERDGDMHVLTLQRGRVAAPRHAA